MVDFAALQAHWGKAPVSEAVKPATPTQTYKNPYALVNWQDGVIVAMSDEPLELWGRVGLRPCVSPVYNVMPMDDPLFALGQTLQDVIRLLECEFDCKQTVSSLREARALLSEKLKTRY